LQVSIKLLPIADDSRRGSELSNKEPDAKAISLIFFRLVARIVNALDAETYRS